MAGFKFTDKRGFDDEGNVIPAPALITAQPTAITPAVPTAANGFGTNISTPYLSELDQLSQQRYQESQAPINTEAIRRQKVSQFQAEIDATNQIYNNLIAKAQIEGQGRIGQQRATASRSGLLGNPRGEAQKEQVQTYNRGIESDISARQQAQIASIMTEAQDRADAEITKREEAKRRGADEYLSYLSGVEATKKTNASAVLQSLLAQGLKLEDIGQEQFIQIANSLKMSPQELTNVYKGELAKVDAANRAAELENYDKSLDRNLKYDVSGDYFAQGKLIRRAADGKPMTQEELFGELGVSSWDEIPEGIIDFSLSTPEDRELLEKNYEFAVGQDLKEREFGFDQEYKGEQLGLDRDKLALDREYKSAQIDIDYKRLDLDERKLLAEGSTKKLTAEELSKFGNLPAGTTWEDIQGMSPISKLSAEEKKLNSIAISAYDSLKTIREKLFNSKGEINRSQIVGSGLWAREYGNAINNLTDSIGRLRSGGAITKDEENRFRSLLPVAYDDANTIRAKLKNIELMFSAIDPADNSSGLKSTDSYKRELDNGGSEGTNPKAPLSQIGPRALASALVSKYPAGSTGGQCGDFVRKVAKSFGLDYARLGDTLASKVAAVKKNGTSLANAGTGSVIVTKENPTYGHVAFIVGRNAQGYVVAESNFKQSNKISYGRVIPYNSPKIIGVINPSKVA
jgi:surface antigen